MTSIPMIEPSPLGVRLLPAVAAWDYERWQTSLVNPGLLLDAVAVALYRIPLLAVPSGADRRGGSMEMADPVFAEALVCALLGRPGFDQLTVSDHVVRWGEPLPEGLALDGRFHGLRNRPRLANLIRPPAAHRAPALAADKPVITAPWRDPAPFHSHRDRFHAHTTLASHGDRTS
ncbi:DUF6302 family protein [Streptomyces sp. MMBL 11-1]|uniref:DUF6302 family protein n=1 Tax=Streptomyces sp. MMBL 11-1 TaxID=3026420 RepID=UPI00235E4D32|nr:DUF6302 family protein [Streptomyces sp. MMBL 11-1]